MIRVLIVDDSAVARKVITQELAKHEDIVVVGTAADPYEARVKIAGLIPDVITLDLEMPRMDGISFLAKLMKHQPLPVVIVSSMTLGCREAALRALELGAIDVISKPGSPSSFADFRKRLVGAIRVAASARLAGPRRMQPAPTIGSKLSERFTGAQLVLAMASSTGGTHAIETVLQGLPADIPGAVIVQHMPEGFTDSFARRLDDICPMQVREARDGDGVVPGTVLIAPGDRHIALQRSGNQYVTRIRQGRPVHHMRPSADVLFHSVARCAGPNAIGVILTGMGADGASGLLAMREKGARTLAQDEHSCVVFGMPKEAIRLGAAEEVVPLHQMAKSILRALSRMAPLTRPRDQ